MNRGSLTPLLTWLRLPRDWYADPRLGMACDEEGPAAAAGWPLLLSRILLNGGRLGNHNELVHALRCLDVGLNMQIAARLAEAFVRHGLVLSDGDGYVVAELDRYVPADNAIPPNARLEAQALRVISPGSRPGVTEGRKEGVKEGEKEGGKESGVGSGGNGVRLFTDENGIDYAVVPEQRKSTEAGCSHGHPWQWRPDGVSSTGRRYPQFQSGNHRLPNGQWCPDRPSDVS